MAGLDVTADPAGVRARIGYIGQKDGAGHNYRVCDELLHAGPLLRPGPATAAARGDELLASLDLDGLEMRKVSTLSGGQKRRLDIALGLIHSPGAAVPRRAVHRDGPAEPGQPVGAHPAAARASTAPRSC